VPQQASATPHAAGTGAADGPASARENLSVLRKELNGLVTAWHHRTGQPHGVVHAELRRTCGGPPSAQASTDDVRKRIEKVREWAARPMPRTRD
jgi:hypothetical protein